MDTILQRTLTWFGFGQAHQDGDHHHGHGRDGHAGHGHGHGHGHTHGVVDPTIATTSRGIWAIKWSFVMLAVTAAAQIVIVYYSGSVALLADTIHNIGDAATAIPLWIAFMLVRRPPNLRFTYGLGRVEDLAGVVIVGIILFSAAVAGWQAIDRLFHPRMIEHVGWVVAAGIIGFLGNEAVAVFRIKVGREIDSAALVADGYHARVDGLTSLAVVLGAFGVWLGFPLADPIVGLIITIMILGIVWQSGATIFTRLLDGADPGLVRRIEHAAGHVRGIRRIEGVRARWLGHRLVAEADIAVDPIATVRQADEIASALEAELAAHLPAFAGARIRIRPDRAGVPGARSAAGHHHAPAPIHVRAGDEDWTIEIIDTPLGERMRLTLVPPDSSIDEASVTIDRGAGPKETLPLYGISAVSRFESEVAPSEPHEFSAELSIRRSGELEVFPFRMTEPEDHDHSGGSADQVA